MMKKLMEILKKWFGKRNVEVSEKQTVETPMKAEVKNKKNPLLESLETYLFSHYDFRFNVLTEQTEYSPKNQADFNLVDQRTLNTLCIEARDQGINCWDKDVSRLMCSKKISNYHPFQDY